jgi:hypothetical protein
MVFGCAGPSQEGFRQLEFTRSGGFVGLDDHLTIRADGTGELRRKAIRRELTIEPEVMNRLLQTLQETQFGGLQREYLAERGADLIEYEITVDGRSVRTEDTAIPETLKPLISQLVEIVER